MSKPVMLFVAPHLSTGGMPQYLLQQVRKHLEQYDVYVAEWVDQGKAFVVQRRQLDMLLGDHFYALDGDSDALLYVLEQIRPDVLCFQEVPEMFLPDELLARIYNGAIRPTTIVETSHSSLPDAAASKRYLPDRFVLVSPYQVQLFASLGVPCEVQEYELPAKQRPDRSIALQALNLDPALRHVLHVGLFTPWKNQVEIITMARRFIDEPVMFHFVGNLADNFSDYWKPLLAELPKNCKVWGERADVSAFYSAMDLFVFPSIVECNPLVVKEALSWGLPVLMRELPTYGGMTFDPRCVTFWDPDVAINDIALRRLAGLPERIPVRIVMFSDEKYEYQVEALLKSLVHTCPAGVPRTYYTVGFASTLDFPGLTKIEWPIDRKKIRFDFYKPGILLDALRRFGSGHYIYFDADVVVGRRFDPATLLHDHDYPMMSVGNWDFPFAFRDGGDGIRHVFDQDALMQYCNVSAATMTYVSACFLSFSDKCLDVLQEWKAVTDNEYLLAEAEMFFPFHDETALNVLLWKRGVRENYGRLFLNTANAAAAVEVERRNDILDAREFLGNPLQRVDDSSRVQFYHGMRNPTELAQFLDNLFEHRDEVKTLTRFESVGIHGVFDDTTGYGVLTTGFSNALSEQVSVRRNELGAANITFADTVSAAGIRERHPWPSILYNAWETTRYPEAFLDALHRYDYLWVPSEWQRQCSIEQGLDPAFVHVVPGGVDVSQYVPAEVTSCEPFVFLMVAKWEPRKSNREICEAFQRAFPLEQYPQVRLQLSCDTDYPCDAYNSTEERLEAFGLLDPRFEIVHHEPRAAYVARMRSAHVFVSCARAEGWGLPIIEAMACGVPTIVADWSGSTEFAQNAIKVPIVGLRSPGGDGLYTNAAAATMMGAPGQWAEPDFEELTRILQDTYYHYGERRTAALAEVERIRRDFSWKAVASAAQTLLANVATQRNVPHPLIQVRNCPPDTVSCSFYGGASVHCWGVSDERYEVQFINRSTGAVQYTSEVRPGTWACASAKYYVDWEIVVTNTRTRAELHREHQDLRGKRVFISLETKALGDTLAWFPYADAFRIRHGCEVVVSTFWNKLFLSQYPELVFVEPGTEVHNLSAHYKVGWFFHEDKPAVGEHHPANFLDQPLQKTATDILGLEFDERRAHLAVDVSLRPTGEGFVGIGVQSTMQAKYWNNKSGWRKLVEWWVADQKRVLIMSVEPDGFMGNEYPKGAIRLPDYNIERVIATMSSIEYFVGVCSGLAWLAWTLGVPTVVIEGASSDHTMPSDVVRVHPDTSVCRFCFLRKVFDKGKWDWCPDHQADDRKFECTTSITAADVIRRIQESSPALPYAWYLDFPVCYDIQSPKVRLGPKCDGGYVVSYRVLDATTRLISAGIGVSGFEEDLYRSKRLSIEMFDGQHSTAPICERFPGGVGNTLFYTPRNIGDKDGEILLARVLKNKTGVLLKLDIEGEEYAVLSGVDLRGVVGILLEVHNLHTAPHHLRTLLDGPLRDFVCYHAHGNNYGETDCGGLELPDSVELSFIARRLLNDIVVEPDTRPYPQPEDRANDPSQPDIPLPWINGLGEPQRVHDAAFCTFTNGPRVSITGSSTERYHISFINRDTGMIEYEHTSPVRHWSFASRKYFVNWEIVVQNERTGEELHREQFDCRGKSVFIEVASPGLGDTLAFIPYVEVFRAKHRCHVTVSTYWNRLLEDQYPELVFVSPGTAPEDMYACYSLGHWFAAEGADLTLHPRDFQVPPLPFQQTGSDILGLPYEELRPRLRVDHSLYPDRPGLVGIGFHTTIQLKYWNNPTGWTEVVEWLASKGKSVVLMSNEPDGCPRDVPRYEGYPGVFNVPGNVPPAGIERLPSYEIERVVAAMSKLELFIGVNSGLSWLAWSLGIPTVVIDGVSGNCFPSEVNEIVPRELVCRFCTRRGVLNAEWDACPDHYSDHRKFECSRSITGASVIERIDRIQRIKAFPRLGHIRVRPDERHDLDMDAVDDVLWRDCYELQNVKNIGVDVGVVVDVGGHVGSFGMRVLELWPEARVFAVEPDSESGALYQQNVPDAVVFDAAVTYDSRQLTLVRDARSTGSSRLFDTGVDGVCMPAVEGVWSVARTAVPRKTLEEIIEEYQLPRIDILKLDCEGSEYSILEHMRPETAAKIGIIVGEYHQEGNLRFPQFHALMSRRFPTWTLRLLYGPNGGPCLPHQGNFIAGPAALIGGV